MQRYKTKQEHLFDYWDIYIGTISAILAIYFYEIHSGGLATLFSAVSIISFSVTVSEIAEILAERLYEPYGSLVLTLSAVVVEILLLFMIILQAHSSNSAIDTVKGGIISAVLVDMNVLLGLAMFVGGLSFKEQEHNEDTSSSYTTILLVTASILLVPSILDNTGHNKDILQLASNLIGGLLFIFYFFIVIFQTKTHIHFFKATARSRILRIKKRKHLSDDSEEHDYFFDKMSKIITRHQ